MCLIAAPDVRQPEEGDRGGLQEGGQDRGRGAHHTGPESNKFNFDTTQLPKQQQQKKHSEKKLYEYYCVTAVDLKKKTTKY